MTLADTGPLVALFDPKDRDHQGAKQMLETLRGPLVTTTPVLTEAFHLLGPSSRGAEALREFITARGLGIWFLDHGALSRAFQLMDQYFDHPMDLADVSLVAAAEAQRITTIFTLDRGDFATYRIRIGKTLKRFRVLDPARVSDSSARVRCCRPVTGLT